MTVQPSTQPHSLVPPGWYPDPSVPGHRWWSGRGWTEHVAPATSAAAPAVAPAAYSAGMSTVVVVGNQKSVGVAFLLTFLFGPLGMLYSTVGGAILMILVVVGGGFLVTLFTLGFGLFLFEPICWLICIIWGCAAASGSGTRVVTQQGHY